MSDGDKMLPLVNDFQIFDVISADGGLLVFTETPVEIIGVAVFNPSSTKFFHIISVPLNIFPSYFVIQLLPKAIALQ